MNKSTVFLILFFFFGFCFPQSSPTSELLEQAERLVYYDPVEARAIAQHEFEKTNHPGEKAKALFLTAISYYITGNYDIALNEAYGSRELAVELGNRDYEEKSKELIDKILGLLYLNREDTPREDWESAIFDLEGWALKGVKFVMEDKLDSARAMVNLIGSELSDSEKGYREMIYYGLIGDIKFKERDFDSSLSYYHKSIEAGRSLGNAYVEKEINQKLAANYLVLDSLAIFQELSRKIDEGNIEFSDIESRASNDAFVLESARLESRLETKKRKYTAWFFTLGGLFLLIGAWGIIAYMRNRNRLETYERMLHYFESSQSKNKAKSSKQAAETNKRKTTMPLKSSEEQIIKGLAKFEKGKKYILKEMSLGMLASELNTNTKYLSEVINRFKGKNFNMYINELRIEYIIDKLKTDEGYLKYKISYLAEESGFSSHSTFTTVFKSIVGISPIKFIEFVRAEKEEKSEQAHT